MYVRIVLTGYIPRKRKDTIAVEGTNTIVHYNVVYFVEHFQRFNK